ncbi:hypothetical protein JYQ62_28925 [Nostoc sp. UHCC 0702]|nr:hypothetical protein JYQ62_28925 [Nostoc sp. UHCC 0702]
MFFGQIEREFFDDEIWSIWYKNKLPEHLQILVDEEQKELVKRDIWELESQELDHKSIHLSSDKNSHH